MMRWLVFALAVAALLVRGMVGSAVRRARHGGDRRDWTKATPFGWTIITNDLTWWPALGLYCEMSRAAVAGVQHLLGD